MGVDDAELERRQEFVVEARRVLVGIRPTVVGVEGDHAQVGLGDDRSPLLLAGLIAQVAVPVVPPELLGVVRVRVHRVEHPARRDDVVVAASRGLEGGASVAAQIVRKAETRANRVPLDDVALLGERAGQVGKVLAGGAALFGEVPFQPLPADTAREGKAVHRIGVLKIERRDVHRGLREEGRGKERHVLRQPRRAVVGQLEVVVPPRPNLDRGVCVVEAELELVPSAKRLIEVVLERRVGLIPVAEPFGVRREVPGPDARGRVEQRLIVAVLVGREEDLVQPEAGIHEHVGTEHGVPQQLVHVEHIVFIARGLLHEQVRGGQEAVRLLVVLA